MRYMGGKCRQSKAIVEVLRPYIGPETVYVEPFCGSMWSAARVCKELHPKRTILNDINKPLMLLWGKCLKEGCDWLPEYPTKDQYDWYKEHQPENDPLTAYIGHGFCFGGKWYGGYLQPTTPRMGNQKTAIKKKTDALGECECLKLQNASYEEVEIPDGAVVYCDPPYAGRPNVYPTGPFNHSQFWDWVRDLSERCEVFISCYDCPTDFETVYEWGDTVTRHYNSKGPDGTSEKLVRYEKGMK